MHRREFGPKFFCWVRTEKRENPIQFFPVTRARARWPTALSSPFAASRMAERRQRRRVGDGRADGPPPSRSNDSGAGPSPSPSSSSTLQGEGGRPARARKLPQYLALSYVGMPVSKAEPLEVEGPPPPPVPPPPHPPIPSSVSRKRAPLKIGDYVAVVGICPTDKTMRYFFIGRITAVDEDEASLWHVEESANGLFVPVSAAASLEEDWKEDVDSCIPVKMAAATGEPDRWGRRWGRRWVGARASLPPQERIRGVPAPPIAAPARDPPGLPSPTPSAPPPSQLTRPLHLALCPL